MHRMELTDSVSDFSKYWLLLQKAHEKEINAVTEEREKWKRLYETECDLVSNLQKQLNVEVERLKKLLNIAETKIAEKEAKIVEKDEIIFCLESQMGADMGSHPNNSTTVQQVDERPGDTSPSLLGNIDPLSNKESRNIVNQHVDGGPTSPSSRNVDSLLSKASPNNSRIINHKWMKRKRRKRLKQTTLTQHQNMDYKHLSLRKPDHSVKVIPQSPLIDLSTLQSNSSDEQDSNGMSDDSSSENLLSNQYVSNQNCDTTNQGDSTHEQNQNPSDFTFAPGTSQGQDTTNQDCTFVHDGGASQVCNLTGHNHDPTNHDYTFVPDTTSHIHSQGTVSQYHNSVEQNSNIENQNSTNQNHEIVNQHLEDQRESKRSTVESKYVAVYRKKSDRNKLDAAPCQECAQWYANDDPKVIKQTCRHRFKYPRPDTPPAYWKIGFPDTAES